jgi:hypothetical protein
MDDLCDNRISAILLICLRHYLRAWAVEWAAEALGMEQLMVKMSITVLF